MIVMSTFRNAFRWFFTVFLLLIVVPPTAWAQSQAEQERARELFERGLEASREGRNGEAVRAYRESFDLFPRPGTLVNLASSQEASGRLVDALTSWNELLERFVAVISAEARTQAQDRIAELERSVAHVAVESQPAGALLLRDGRELGTSPLGEELVLDAGEVVFEARLEGYDDSRTTVRLRAGANPPVVLTLEPEDDAAPAPPVVRPTLIVESLTDGATVTLDDRPPLPAPMRTAIEPGDHRVRVEAPGFEAESRDVMMPESDEEVHLSIDLAPVGGRVSDDDDDDEGFWHGPWPWIIGGVILAGAGLGIGLGVGLNQTEPVDPDLSMRLR